MTSSTWPNGIPAFRVVDTRHRLTRAGRKDRGGLDHGSGHGTSYGGQAQRSPPAAARDSVDCASACPPYGRNDDQGHRGDSHDWRNEILPNGGGDEKLARRIERILDGL